MSDKARFFLERSVPELQDLEKKKLFTKREITMIMRRRTDFEHRIAGRGSKPSDFLQYVKYEKNLERLRKKRYERMKPVIDTKPSISDWASSRRIFFVFDRGVNKFPQSLELWGEYLKFARKNGSVKVAYTVYSKLLQLQPRNVNVWFSAAKYEFEYNKNVKSARTLLKRCLRFNGDEVIVWLEFIKFELNYLSKLLIRRKLFNLITERQQMDDLKEHEQDSVADGEEIIQLVPDTEINDELNSLPEMNLSTLGSIENNPVLRGDIILTLYDVCIATLTKGLTNEKDEKFNKIWEISTGVLRIIDQFDVLDRLYLCNHIVSNLNDAYPTNGKVILLQLTLNLRYIKLTDKDFVTNLHNSVKLYQAWLAKSKNNDEVKETVRKEYISFLNENYLQHSTGEIKELLQMLINKL